MGIVILILYNSPDYHKVKVLVDRMVNRAIEASEHVVASMVLVLEREDI